MRIFGYSIRRALGIPYSRDFEVKWRTISQAPDSLVSEHANRLAGLASHKGYNAGIDPIKTGGYYRKTTNINGNNVLIADFVIASDGRVHKSQRTDMEGLDVSIRDTIKNYYNAERDTFSSQAEFHTYSRVFYDGSNGRVKSSDTTVHLLKFKSDKKGDFFEPRFRILPFKADAVGIWHEPKPFLSKHAYKIAIIGGFLLGGAITTAVAVPILHNNASKQKKRADELQNANNVLSGNNKQQAETINDFDGKQLQPVKDENDQLKRDNTRLSNENNQLKQQLGQNASGQPAVAIRTPSSTKPPASAASNSASRQPSNGTTASTPSIRNSSSSNVSTPRTAPLTSDNRTALLFSKLRSGA